MGGACTCSAYSVPEAGEVTKNGVHGPFYVTLLQNQCGPGPGSRL